MPMEPQSPAMVYDLAEPASVERDSNCSCWQALEVANNNTELVWIRSYIACLLLYSVFAYICFTELATESCWTQTLKPVQPIQTRSTV